MYTIVDLEEEIRGTDGYGLGPYDYYSQEDCDAYLKELEEGMKREKDNDGFIIQDSQLMSLVLSLMVLSASI